jgi:creatinine amidohydrolase/Fe(II)-dependent formamide hydrolase-like protein
MSLTPFLPNRINTGPWLVGYSLSELKNRVHAERIVLPICSLGTPPEELARLAPLVLPPLYHEAFEGDLKSALLDRIHDCFPYFAGTKARAEHGAKVEVVELPPHRRQPPVERPRILAFSVDTAVEEHGPHLPLATDTIQSYAVLNRLATETDGLLVGVPVDYGQLTWGLPFGLSIDFTAPLVTRYVCSYVNAILDWMSPEALYVVDVHGSLVHRNAIQEGLRRSRCDRWAFRWLHEPLVEFAGDRGDQHAGGVETAMVEHINRDLVDSRWWPGRIEELAAGEMTMARAMELSSDLGKFIAEVESQPLNGIVGRIRNYHDVNAEDMMNRMLAIARQDVSELLERGGTPAKP